MAELPIPDPPASANKWLGLLDAVVIKQLIPILLLIFVVWDGYRREDKNNAQHAATITMMREDLVASRLEVSRLLDKLLAISQLQATEVKAAVKEVKTEVRATTDAVKAATATPDPNTIVPPAPVVPR